MKVIKRMLKENLLAFIVVFVIGVLMGFLIFLHENKLTNLFPVPSALIGALGGSLVTFYMGKENQKKEKVRAKRRMIRLLKYTQSKFPKDSLFDYRHLLNRKYKIANLKNVKIVFDEEWTKYISFLDEYLEDEEINNIIIWLEQINKFEGLIKRNFNETIYIETIEEIERLNQEIESIIKKLEPI
ncbi:hypothetical protein [Bacillus sonorensis]|uniref:hypothetical protein n=1 Tax=Bacillus sonorensis TaxID=119858 RepID=UPI00098B4D9C|nr:hypothetical protein [Bacillus sonorensis]MCY8271301.1 hypothetical protein [Bacillus sonorensis]MCY8606617.1 hypothetical protein [Bacillus sonorensis]